MRATIQSTISHVSCPLLSSGSGKEWSHWVAKENSGTYNNQYLVLDLKKFKPAEELQPGLLTIIEQIPGAW